MKTKELLTTRGTKLQSATVIEANDGTEILISYTTPVAAYTEELGYVYTSEKYSCTTTKAINLFLFKGTSTEVEQSVIDEIYKNI